MKKNYNFESKFKLANLISLFLVAGSLLLITFKGLNFGIDFKGGTLIELRTDSKNIEISDIRSAFSNMNLGDLNVKEFGKEGDYLIKFEKKTFKQEDSIKNAMNVTAECFCKIQSSASTQGRRSRI